MEPPGRVSVCGIDYELRLVTDAQEPLIRSHWGRIEYTRRTMYVRSDCAPAEQGHSALHEMLHAIDEALDLHLKEGVVKRLACGLWDALQRNPELRAWMFQEGGE